MSVIEYLVAEMDGSKPRRWIGYSSDFNGCTSPLHIKIYYYQAEPNATRFKDKKMAISMAQVVSSLTGRTHAVYVLETELLTELKPLRDSNA